MEFAGGFHFPTHKGYDERYQTLHRGVYTVSDQEINGAVR
jgi:hypothetical protein